MNSKKFNVLLGAFVGMCGILIITTTANGEITETKLTGGCSFGRSVSISGEYAVVGSPSTLGSAYIFKYDGTTWTEQAILTPSDWESEGFGMAVAISGDYVIIGAPYSGSETGSAYIFKRDGTTWTQQAKLTASDGIWFGFSVCLFDDYAIIGAPYSESSYIFKRDDITWSKQAKLSASGGPFWEDWFGQSVSISGEYAIVGTALGKDTSGRWAYIFKRDGTTWTQQTKLTGDDYAFGWSVSVSGDYVIVGGIGYAGGSAYIFERDGTTWTQQAKLIAGDGISGDQFGWSVAISSDYVLVGTPFHDENTGSAYIFKRDGTTWSQQAKLIASDGISGDQFGISVSITSDYALVGAFLNNDCGASYVYPMSTSPDQPGSPKGVTMPWIPLLLLEK